MRQQDDRALHPAVYLCVDARKGIDEAEGVRYYLYKSDTPTPRYFTEIYLNGECSAAFLGEGERAVALFEDLVHGGVTPCTLVDIVEDFRKSHTVLPCFADYC